MNQLYYGDCLTEMQSKIPSFTILLALLCYALIGCADNPTAPDTLTEAEIEALIDARVAEELAKMEEAKDGALSPQAIAQIALRSTVYISVKTQKKSYYGSGFVVAEGLIATCEHVLEGMVSGTIESVFDEKKYPITAVLAVSKKHDLAIIEVKGFTVPALTLGDSDTVQVGDTVYVTGNPKKWKGTFSEGVIGGIRPQGSHFVEGEVLQITAPTAPGSSGGPVLNKNGDVIAVLSETELGAENLNFAVVSNHLKTLLETIR